MLSDADLVQGCMDFSPIAQKELYSRYAAKMRGVCVRYCSDKEEVKDLLQDSFITIFTKIASYKGSGSLEGWIRRIVVNKAINHYNKNKKKRHSEINDEIEASLHEDSASYENDISGQGLTNNSIEFIQQAEFSLTDLLEALNVLPEIFRLSFNLFYIEKYSHKEIADMLNIDEKTSRTRCFRARKKLQEHLYNISKEKINNTKTNVIKIER